MLKAAPMLKVTRLSEFGDMLATLVVAAPDRFPSIMSRYGDAATILKSMFKSLEDAFPLVEKKIKSPEKLLELRGLLAQALAAYQQGDRKGGAQLLVKFRGIVFPNAEAEYVARKGVPE
jgi:hypothetical protein